MPPRLPRSGSSPRCRATCPRWASVSNSVDLAIKQANEATNRPRVDKQAGHEDDQAKPDVGANPRPSSPVIPK